MPLERETADLVIIGAGAAGLATAIFAARARPALRVLCLDSARRVGAKILVSGGSRCNVTNRIVTERDFWGGSSRVVRHVLRAFPADRTAAFFEALGVSLHEEDDGKLFPDTNRSRTVLEALLDEAARLNVSIRTEQRVTAIERRRGAFAITTGQGGQYAASSVVLATGGRSLPKSGSDGLGYELARTLGHGYIETTPALAPLVIDDEFAASLTGVAHPATLTLRVDGRASIRLEGALLWTHFGASGPVVLNASRHWLRARLEGRTAALTLNVCPAHSFETLEQWLLTRAAVQPRSLVATSIATLTPSSVAAAWLKAAGIEPSAVMAHLTREARRRLVHCLVDRPLQVRDSRGYAYAEVTAGGIPLDEIDPATMASRRCSGLYLVGEILDVDGRLGGFNFQWAWSSAWVAAQAIARSTDTSS